jgi:catechol 2,3-dioxygenase-like lactoylglutathione lyase family enzyme
MIIGTHLICYSRDADADRKFFQEILEFSSVDAGRGWLIFALPPSEVAFHPGEEESQELYLLCDDLDPTMERLRAKGVEFEPPAEARWGRVTRFALPSGTKVGLYQPYHPLAITPGQAG